MKSPPIPRDDVRDMVTRIAQFTQESAGVAEKTDLDALALQCESDVLQILDKTQRTATDLRRTASAILQMSRDPRRLAVVGRMYAIAYRRGDDDAGYSWSTMVLEGMLPGPTPELTAAYADEATQTYAQLARKGHAQSQFGMGRLVLAKALADTETSVEPPAKQVQMAVDLWQRAGRNGHADAWFELGQLYHHGRLVPRDQARALTCFEHGARGGSAQASHALGTLYLKRAHKQADAHDTSAASQCSALAARYFLQAAKKGHAASAYNVGLLYMDSGEGTKAQHKVRHGVLPDDRSAREWFAAAASKSTLLANPDFLPAMMNYGAMLMEHRGSGASDTTASDLEEARRVYERALRIGTRAQQRTRSALTASSADDSTPDVAAHMMSTARYALERLDQRLGSTGTTPGVPDTSGASERQCAVM